MKNAVITGYRKLAKSVHQRGVVATGVRCCTRPLRALASSSQWLSPTFRRIRHEHRLWDQQHGVDTAPGNKAGWLADIQSENWSHGRGYHPAPSASLEQRLRDLCIPYENFTFIDYGSGKGRSLFAASNFPFAEIIGVEFNRYLHETAQANVGTYRSSQQACFNITPVHEDAARYPIPDGPLVIYFYDPFGEPVMRPVVENIFASLQAEPRKCFIVYYNPVFAEYFEESELFVRRAAGKEFEAYWNRTKNGDKDANEFLSEVLDAERYVVYESIS